MEPKSKLLVVVDVGTRTLAMAQRVVHQGTQVLAPSCVPLLLTDGFKVMFGTPLAIEQLLAACGWTINTAFVERLNLAIRQWVAAIGRRINTLCQGEVSVQNQLALFQIYHNFSLAPRQSAPGIGRTEGHQRPWLGEEVAAVHTGDGGKLDGPRVVAQRGVVLPGAAVAPYVDGLNKRPNELPRSKLRGIKPPLAYSHGPASLAGWLLVCHAHLRTTPTGCLGDAVACSLFHCLAASHTGE
jgi:hypothetical protein